MEYIATFHTHLGALRMEKRLKSLGDAAAVMMPVPRKLSASCGTCVSFSMPFERDWANEDLDSVYIKEGDQYKAIFINEE